MKDALHVLKLPAGHQQQLATGLKQTVDCIKGWVIDYAVVRERPVIIRGENGVTHGS